ncbi:MAG TPA: toll/interleukin-1 receptor domain-containing protein [Opitutus sp.]|nr:toll/interleukin-1 receptor domain-containing protein [Opitutus sp.]
MPDGPATSPPPPSIFLSYASEDRAAARALRETLAQAGLEVWLDEEELAGGDAWDAKIRQQIRTCNYFMPIVSTTTEARREGYFRREWRFAIERTLDLADDVMFLVPVVIDDTIEQGARVPEKFLTVQWLRCPAGHETPTLRMLAARLVAEHHAAHAPAPPRAFPPTGATRPPINPPTPPAPPPLTRAERRAERRERQPPPCPAFPAFPARHERARFVYDIVVWAGHLIVAFWWRLPGWLRLVATVFIVFKVVGFAINFGSGSHNNDEDRKPHNLPTAAQVDAALKQSGDAGRDSSDAANKILHATAAALDAFQSGRPLAVVVFSATDSSVKGAALKSFSGVRDALRNAGHEKDVAIGVIPFNSGTTEPDILARAAALRCRWLLVGEARPEPADEFTLAVKLYETATRKIVWQAERRGDRDAADQVGGGLAHDLLQQISFESSASPPAPPPAPKP